MTRTSLKFTDMVLVVTQEGGWAGQHALLTLASRLSLHHERCSLYTPRDALSYAAWDKECTAGI